MTGTNGFATKSDLKKLKLDIDRNLDKRFSWFRSEIKDDFEIWRKDTFRQFEHRWQQQIDPIMVEIAKHREKEILHWHQYDRILNMFNKIAKKVGVAAED